MRLVSLFSLAALLPTVSLADAVNNQPPRAVVAAFESLDRNADHKLSRSEAGFDRVLSEVFADTDTDGDGYLTKTEYATITKDYNVAAR